MIVYEIQLWYEIQNKIQSKTNPVQDKIWKIVRKKILSEKNSQTEFCLRCPVHIFELSWTHQCLSSLSSITYCNNI